MFIQKIKIILPDEVEELIYDKNEDYIKYNLNDLNEVNHNIVLYKTFDTCCSNKNNFELFIYHKDYEWKNFSIIISPPNYYISKIEYKIMFNKLFESFYIL